MKKNKIYLNIMLGACALFWVSACSQTSDNKDATTTQTEEHANHDMTAGTGNSTNKMMDLMHENMTDMEDMKPTGDVDRDFANLMAIHHEGALVMAQEEVENGQDTLLINLSKNILASQKTEQNKLESLAKNIQTNASDTTASKKLMQSMDAMMKGMNHNVNGTLDYHFASLMKMHHQSAVDMVQAYLPNAKSPELKAMAQKMMIDQQKEIAIFDTWVKEHPQQ